MFVVPPTTGPTVSPPSALVVPVLTVPLVSVPLVSSPPVLTSLVSSVGVASTAISWLSFMEVVKVSPYTQLIVNILSIIWLSLQIYNFVNTKIIKRKK